MSKRKQRKRDSISSHTNTDTSSVVTADVDARPVIWSTSKRTIASILLAAYLAIVLIGPLSNPVASPHFSAPLAAKIAPLHRILFLGHGYRFFAPDPGPSHRVIYRGLRADGSKFEGHFPDRNNHWPRLLYHRWFMLSETLFNENMLKPTATQLDAQNKQYEREIERYRAAGKLDLCEQLKQEREQINQAFRVTEQRVEVLASGIAKVLLERNNGQSIELFVQEREIPFPEQVASGMKLEDDAFLSELLKIGEMDADGYQAAVPEPSGESVLPGASSGEGKSK
jgi:hypothetical protein